MKGLTKRKRGRGFEIDIVRTIVTDCVGGEWHFLTEGHHLVTMMACGRRFVVGGGGMSKRCKGNYQIQLRVRN